MTAQAAKRPGVLVRGACSNGHVTETNAEPRRVTAQVDCAECGERVQCKRIPKTATAPPVAPAGEAGSTRVLRIDDYEFTASGAQDDAGGLAVAGTGGHEPDVVEPATGADAGRAPDPITEPERHSVAGWWHARRRAAAIRSARRRSVEPGHPLGI